MVGNSRVLPYDCLGDFFKGSNPVVKFLEVVRSDNLCVKFVVCSEAAPKAHFQTIADLDLPVDFLDLLFKSSKFVTQFSEDERRHLFCGDTLLEGSNLLGSAQTRGFLQRLRNRLLPLQSQQLLTVRSQMSERGGF